VAFITKRKKGGKTFFYLARAFRKNGVPTHEILVCLGTADDIKATYSGHEDSAIEDTNPSRCRIYQFGAVSALYDIANRLNIAGIIDEHVPKRKQGLSVGSYMVLAAINRAVQPVSKNTFHDWFSETVLAGSFPQADKHTLSGQSFWNHMIELDQETIINIEDKITARIIQDYDISTDCLLFDNTNFLTYIDTANKATIPQRGHSKEKRTDLKIVGLSLLANSDYNIPLFHETYPGNRHDTKQIMHIIHNLKNRLMLINNKPNDLTIVFDKGNNSKEFIETLDNDSSFKFHFVGGLRLNQCPELFTFQKEQYTPLVGEKLSHTSAVRFQKEIYDRNLTVIITDNPRLKAEQLEGFHANIVKCDAELKSLQDNLKQRISGKITKGRKPTCLSVTNKIQKILSAEHMKKIFSYNVSNSNNQVSFSYNLDAEKYDFVVDMCLGKSILFTNRNNWSNEQIVATYRSQFHVEENFKQLINTKYLTFRPIRHFTDRTIIVHAFYCVLALTLSSLLRFEFDKLGYQKTINSILSELSEARQSLHVYEDDTKKMVKFSSAISETSKAAEEYIAKNELKKYALNF
jgi:transposase